MRMRITRSDCEKAAFIVIQLLLSLVLNSLSPYRITHTTCFSLWLRKCAQCSISLRRALDSVTLVSLLPDCRRTLLQKKKKVTATIPFNIA
jgi:hypothetical protein